jgi:hypothetical protein
VVVDIGPKNTTNEDTHSSERRSALRKRLTGSAFLEMSDDAVYSHESSKVLSDVLRDYQPIWRILSRMSPL